MVAEAEAHCHLQKSCNVPVISYEQNKFVFMLIAVERFRRLITGEQESDGRFLSTDGEQYRRSLC